MTKSPSVAKTTVKTGTCDTKNDGCKCMSWFGMVSASFAITLDAVTQSAMERLMNKIVLVRV